jgi:predicted component of type VI protein secretion system
MTLRRESSGRPLTLREQIARNLEAVLNARRGFDSVVEVYGVSEPERIDRAPSALRALEAEMTELVRKYEPRVEGASVRCVGRRGSLHAEFSLEGSVDGEKTSFALRYSIVFRNVVVVGEDRASGER